MPNVNTARNLSLQPKLSNFFTPSPPASAAPAMWSHAARRILLQAQKPSHKSPFTTSSHCRMSGRPRIKTSRERNDDTLFYTLSLGVATTGIAYAAVPLYKMFCQQTGFGGTVSEGHDPSKVKALKAYKV